MKAIKIPDAALLDVFGRPVAINNHDVRRSSVAPSRTRPEHNVNNADSNNREMAQQIAAPIDAAVQFEDVEHLTVIGQSNVRKSILELVVLLYRRRNTVTYRHCL
jgi:hypothetical protein